MPLFAEPVSRILQGALSTNKFHLISIGDVSIRSPLSHLAEMLARFGHGSQRREGYLSRLRRANNESVPSFHHRQDRTSEQMVIQVPVAESSEIVDRLCSVAQEDRRAERVR
jgi:hypothetical protein